MTNRALSSSSPNWADLPEELVESILDNLAPHLPDYIRFGAVCKPWKSVTARHYKRNRILRRHQLPWLLASPVEDDHLMEICFHNLAIDELCSFGCRQPFSDGKSRRVRGSSHGWLVFTAADNTLTVFNPLSNTTFQLPHPSPALLSRVAVKIVFSEDPSFGEPFEALLFTDHASVLAHLNSKDQFWSRPDNFDIYKCLLEDVAFYKGGIFAATDAGYILSVEVSGGVVNVDEIGSTAMLEDNMLDDLPHVERFFVETTNSDLLLVNRYCDIEHPEVSVTYRVYKLILYQKRLVKIIPVKDLGGDCLFVGTACEGISVLADNFPGCWPNAIYFANSPQCIVPDQDIEVYFLEDGSLRVCCLPEGFRKVYHLATWVVPTIKF